MFNEKVTLKSHGVPARIAQKMTYSQKDVRISMHYHDEIELLCIDESEFFCNVNGCDIVLAPGDIIFINSRVPHSTFVTSSVKYSMIQINTDKLIFSESPGSFISSLILGIDIPYYVFHNGETRTQQLRSICTTAFSEHFSTLAGSSSILLGALHTLVGFLIREGIISNPDDALKNRRLEKVAPAIAYMAENFAVEITTPELAALCGLNTRYFCQLFKSATGKTSVEFLNLLRVHRAEKLINTTRKSIIDIALEVGFSTPSYFDRVFKKVNGCSPSYYRRLRFGETEV